MSQTAPSFIPARPFAPAERDAVYRAIHERRDMRHFSGGQVSDEVLERLLQAAHHAPSVGFMQPWRFIRIRDRQRRLRYPEHVAGRARRRAGHGLGLGLRSCGAGRAAATA